MIQKYPSFHNGRKLGAKVNTTALLFLFFTLDSYAADHTETLCLSPCQCSLLGDGTMAADCLLGNHTDYEAIAMLPSNTTELTCTVTGKLEEESLELNALGQLRKLFIKPQKSTTYSVAKFGDTVSQIRRTDLLLNQSSLVSLGINIIMWEMTPDIFNTIPNLKYLDLSHTFLFSKEWSYQILHNMTLSGHRLQTLNLSGFQRADITVPVIPILTRDHIYSNIRNYPIRTLELLDNDVVALQAGLTTYLPQAEVVRVGSRRLLYIVGRRGCFNVETFLMHPVLKELFISFPLLPQNVHHKTKRSVFETDTHTVTPSMVECLLNALFLEHENIFCAAVNCICDGELHVPCDRIPNITISEVLDFTDGCYDNTRFPFAPQLERLSLLNLLGLDTANNTIYKMHFDDLRGDVVKICFSPKTNLKYFDVSFQIPKPGILELAFNFSLTGFQKLEYLNAQRNALLYTPNIRAFADMPSLKTLLLGGNKVNLTPWESLDFLHLPGLETLDLESCELKHVPQQSFSMLENLRVLNLSDNGITQFDANLTHNLRALILSRNNLGSLPQMMTDYLDTVAETHNISLDLSSNPLLCFCEEQKFVHWLKFTRVKFENKETTFCAHPTVSQIHPWDVDTTKLHLICINFDAIISSLGSAIGASALIAAVAVLYRKRWRIRFWIHATRNWWRNERPECQGYQRVNFTYDAFVAYSSHGEERTWVHTTLREKLEGEFGFRLCFYYRDFKLGVDLADAIVEGINSSNKTLLILSPTFLQSGWCEFEVRMAKEKLMAERRDSLVVIIYSKLDEGTGRFPKSLVRLLEKKIYIEWTEDPDGKELFWTRLVAAIRNEREHDGFAGCEGNSG